MSIKEKVARWYVAKYLPDMHLHANPKVKKERKSQEEFEAAWKPNLRTGEEYVDWRKSVKAAPDPRDYEDPAEFEHEREKWVMKMEAQRGDR
jgi:hypothetical protein